MRVYDWLDGHDGREHVGYEDEVVLCVLGWELDLIVSGFGVYGSWRPS